MIQCGTYLEDGLKEEILVRWPDKLMPLNVYVAPFNWYQKSKQKDSHLYMMLVMQALKLWAEATGGKFSFRMVNQYNNSNINVLWRRVNRESLGMCHSRWTKEGYIYSAELEIGISDGILHALYEDVNEVKHTIIHEVGHAIGLGHSNNADDIMYVPHQYGTVEISQRDINSARWLYNLEPGFDYRSILPRYKLPAHTSIDELIWVYENQDKIVQMQEEKAQNQVNESKDPALKKLLDIEEQQEFLAAKNILNLATQKIKPKIPKKNFNSYNPFE